MRERMNWCLVLAVAFLALQFSNSLFSQEVKGKVIALLENNRVQIDLGSEDGVAVGMKARLFYMDQEAGGKIYVAVIEVLEVADKSSIAQVTKEEAKSGLVNGSPESLENAKSEEYPEEWTNSIGMRFRLIPAGEFMMGAVPEDGDALDFEMPRHRVEITKPFYLGIHEVTQAQYMAVMGVNPSNFKGDDRPVENVYWDDAVDFCEKLSRKEGKSYRLPTEAEWEYACRAGSTSMYYWGNSMDDSYAWYAGNSGDQTHPAGLKQPNAWGLYDMSGNVWEWCADWFDADFYGISTSRDPQGPVWGDSLILRGGAWNFDSWFLRASCRNRRSPEYSNYAIGFRILLEVEENPSVAQTTMGNAELGQQVEWYEPLKASGITTAAPPKEWENAVGMKFRLIPAGSYMMGASPWDNEPEDNEKPRHRVEISRPFYLGVYEVTQEQWQKVMGTTLRQQRDKVNKSRPIQGEGTTYPIYYVSWQEAVAFCEELSRGDGENYRLPTEAEWEYACRAGTETKFSWGNVWCDFYAWCGDNSEGEAHPVGWKRPNTWELYDMNGNIWEWCSDWYSENYYASSPAKDPQGPPSGDYRVIRGGSWSHGPWGLRPSYRYMGTPGLRIDKLGFRVLREVK